jgi:DNA polymerase-3 subunit beta
MKITIERDELIRVLGWLVKFTEPKSASFWAKCVRFDAMNGAIVASATNLEISGSESVAGTVREEGGFACDGKSMIERARFFAPGTIAIETVEDSKVLMQAGSQRYALKSVPLDDMPKIPPVPTSKQTQIPATALGRLIDKVTHAISDDFNRPHIHSALIECEAAVLRMVATDGHLLTKCEVAIAAGRPFEMLVTKRAVVLLAEQCGRAADGLSVQISTKGDKQFFQIGAALLISQVPQATFPTYQQVIPKRRRHATANRAEFLRALKVTGIDDGRVGISFNRDELSISGRTADGEIAAIEIPAACSFMHAMPIGVNAKTLAEQVDKCDDESIQIDVDGELDPVMILSEKDPGFVAINMPMRL